VGLERRVAGLHHHGVVLEHQLVDALDADLVVLAAQPGQRVVERAVAGEGGHVVEAEVALADRGEDPREDDLDADGRRGVARALDELDELPFHPGEAVPGEPERVEVRLEVEERELRRVVAVLQALEDLQGGRGGPPVAVHEEHLLLGADPLDARLEPAVLEHPLQGAQVREERAHEGAQAGALLRLDDPLLAHGSSLGSAPGQAA
jgi:hypothetical protein